MGSADDEADDLVDTLFGVEPGKHHGITCTPQVLRVNALDDTAFAHVEAGNDTFCKHARKLLTFD